MEGQTENFEIPSRWRRFSAYLLDIILDFTVIGLFVNLVFALIKKTTLGNEILGIKTLDKNNAEVSLGKASLRYLIFYPHILLLYPIIIGLSSLTYSFLNYGLFPGKIKYFLWIVYYFIAFCVPIINIIELFFICPTFIDKRLGIKRIFLSTNKTDIKKQPKNSVSLEIPSRWRRLSAYLLDIILDFTIIGLFVNIVFILTKKTTLGNEILGIESLNVDGKELGLGQISLRYLIFYPHILFLSPIIIIMIDVFSFSNNFLTGGTSGTTEVLGSIYGLILICIPVINIIELFFKCPTFIDKRLGIKRFYKKSK